MRFGRVGFGEAVDLDAQQLREARLQVARKNKVWVEVADDLVERPLGQLVSAGNDLVYTLYRGAVWESGTANAISERTPLHFFVRATSECVFVTPTDKTWSSIMAKRNRVPA